MGNASDYIDLLIDTLVKKSNILQAILELTERQITCAQTDHLDMDLLNGLIEQKDRLIAGMEDLDDGFNAIFIRAREELNQNKNQYRPEIQHLQELVRETTELGVAIEAAEHRCKDKLADAFQREKQSIQKMRRFNTSANQYQKQMSQTQVYESVLFNKKN